MRHVAPDRKLQQPEELRLSMRTIFAAVILAAALPLCAAEKTFTIVYTNSLNGYIDYCTCKADPKGGLVKRGTAFSQLRKEYRGKTLIAVDTGDLFPAYTSDLLAPYLMKAVESLRYDAIAFGDQDLDPSIPRFIQLAKDLPIVNTNLSFPSRTPANPWPGYRIVKTNGFIAAIVAVQSKEAYRYTREITRKGVAVEDPAAAVERAIAACAKENPDIVILLSHCGYDQDLALSEKIKGIGVIVGGHSQTFIEEPVVQNGRTILQAGTNGSHIGICEITVEGTKVKRIRNRFVTPDMNRPADDPYIRSLIKEYRAAEDASTRSFD